jgi:hypothetical protein
VKISPILLAVVALPSSLLAHPIKWTATGAVTQVTAGVYDSVAVSDPVEVEFSYDSGSYINGLSRLDWGDGIISYKAEFSDDVKLDLRVKIGEQTWQAALPVSPRGEGVYSFQSLSWDGGGSPDTLTLTVSSSDSGTFPAFPYTGANTARRMEIILTDTVKPCDFLHGQNLPGGATDISQITAATGSITAGLDAIRFGLDLASITVVEEEPKIPITIQRTLTGLELKWYGEPGAVYQLLESGDLTDWEFVSDHEGLDEEISVTVEPFELHPERRFYKVIQL